MIGVARAGLAAELRVAFGAAVRDPLYRNSLSLMAVTVLTSALGYVYWVLAARAYPPATVGSASTLIAAMILAANLAGVGLGSALIGRLAGCTTERQRAGAFRAALILAIGGGTIAGFAAALALPHLLGTGCVGAIDQLLLVIGAPLWSVAAVVDARFVAELAAARALVRNGAFALLKLGLLAMAVAAIGGSGAELLLASWVFATAASAAPALVRRSRVRGVAARAVIGGNTTVGAGAVPPRPSTESKGELRRDLGALLRHTAGNHGTGLGEMAWRYLLPVLTTARLSPAETAYGAIAWMIGGLAFMISSAVSTALFAHGVRHRDTGGALRRGSALIAVGLAPAMLLCLLAGGKVLALLGPGYAAHATALLTLLCAAALPDAITNLATMSLRVRGKLGWAAALNLGMAGIALGLAWLLLPRLGIIGGGWAWLAAQLAGSLAVLVAVLRTRRTGRATIRRKGEDDGVLQPRPPVGLTSGLTLH